MKKLNQADRMKDCAQVHMFGLDYCACTLTEAAQMVVHAARSKTKGLIVTPNVDHVVSMQKDAEMFGLYQQAMFRFADGMPLVWFSKILRGHSLPERVTGADLLPEIARLAALKGLTLYFLGGMPGVAEKAALKLKRSYPLLRVVGTYSPPFGFDKDSTESERIVDMINASGADILFVGVGAPKQEKWAAQYMARLNVGPILGVGASFDFAAGTIKRAPLWMQRSGMEWSWRLMQEPGRMWKRYILKDSQFVWLMVRELMKSR